MHLLTHSILDPDANLSQHFMPHQVAWINSEKFLYKQNQQAVALATLAHTERRCEEPWAYP